MKNKIEVIKQLIAKYGLNTKSRKREKVYQRCYLINELRNFFNTNTIGDLFNRDHSTVVYATSIARLYTGMKDRLYMDTILEIKTDYEMIMKDQYTFYVRCNEYNQGLAVIELCTYIDRELISDLQLKKDMNLSEFREWMNKLKDYGTGLDQIA